MTSPSNLLRGAWTQDALCDLLARHPAKPLLPPLGDAAWRAVAAKTPAQEFLAPLRSLAEAECGEPLPVLTDALYADFCETGIRLNFERAYFERRRRLGRAAICLLLAEDSDPWRERLTTSLQEKFRSIFGEASWALPAHVNWGTADRSGKDPMQIDLFCAETANLMAEILDVFGSILSPELQAQVRERLQRGIFENYLSRDFHWMTCSHNWNAVCHQGVVGAALSQVGDPRQLAAILARMRANLPHFLEGFGPDGGCSEGPSYWNYGFGWFAALNAQLETRTAGELSLFEGDDHIRAIARYGPLMALRNGHLVNFADAGATGSLDPALLTYLGERLQDASCAAAAGESFCRLHADANAASGQRADFFHLSRWMRAFPSAWSAAGPVPGDCFLPDLAVLVARGTDPAGRAWEFAAKGGHNGEHHNHNDCGSFLLNLDGHRRIAEIGAPEYVHDFFQPAKRYQFLAARSLGHSVPLVNGHEQATGPEFAAKVLVATCGAARVEFALDLTACYPAEARCRRLQRTWLWEKSASWLKVSDTYELEGPGQIESALICLEAPNVFGSEVTVAGLSVLPSVGTRYAGFEPLAYRDHSGRDATIFRLRFEPEGAPTSSGHIEFLVSPSR